MSDLVDDLVWGHGFSASSITLQGGSTNYEWSYKPYQWPYEWVTVSFLRDISPNLQLDPGPTL